MAKNERDFAHKMGSFTPAPRSANVCPLKEKLVDLLYAELDCEDWSGDTFTYYGKRKPKKSATKKSKKKKKSKG